MQGKALDDFADVSGWTAIASGQAELRISQDPGAVGTALRLDFDFHGGGGFVVARKAFRLDIPESYSFRLRIRGSAPRNIFEFKLVDESNRNVWRYRVEEFDFRDDWEWVQIRSSRVEFAWGPLGGGPPRDIAAIELVIAAGPGGKGTVWCADLRFQDDTYRLTPVVIASSALAGHPPQNLVNPATASSWRSLATASPQWLLVDFGREREFGGLVIHWEEHLRGRAFEVEVSLDGKTWGNAYATGQGDSRLSYLYLPNTLARYVRLNLLSSTEGHGFGIRGIEVKPYDFSRSLNHFFQNIARDYPAGLYPKYFQGRQTYWTPVGSGHGDGQALVNEEGMVEVDKGSFSIAPFLYVDGTLVTWADVETRQELVGGYLPIPAVGWRTGRGPQTAGPAPQGSKIPASAGPGRPGPVLVSDRPAVPLSTAPGPHTLAVTPHAPDVQAAALSTLGLLMRLTAFAEGSPGRSVLYLCYRVENTSNERRSVVLFTALLPFQVTPTWQNWRAFGGVTPIRELCLCSASELARDFGEAAAEPAARRIGSDHAADRLGSARTADGAMEVAADKVDVPLACAPADAPSLGGAAVLVNGTKAVIPLTHNATFGAAAFAEGGVTEYLALGELPRGSAVRDEFGYASGALRFDLDLAPGSADEIVLAVPFGEVRVDQAVSRTGGANDLAAAGPDGLQTAGPDVRTPTSRVSAVLAAGSVARAAASVCDSTGAVLGSTAAEVPGGSPQRLFAREQFGCAVKRWESVLNTVEFHLPPQAQALADTWKTAAAHILVNRDGPALHPGPRRYSRSWIRDGVLMGAALLRLGCNEALRDFIRWYKDFQAEDGKIPDCADREGTEWLPEFDAYGQLIYAVMEYYRFTGDQAFLREMRPAVIKTLAFMEGLRNLRLTPEYQGPDKRACYGMLPESMSHEGYMAHPVHAYWDDFWALRGLKDAALMAEVLGERAEAERLASLAEMFSEDLRASLAATIAKHGIDYVPGSVEFGDFDPAATSIALSVLDQITLQPRPEIERTYDRYLAGFRDRARSAMDWNNYSAYEIRIIGALVRLGRRRDALELARFMLADRRIPAWNQWPEISWRDPLGPSFIGDLPHTWISGEYIIAVRSLFAYEREADDSLVIAAGLDPDWLAGGSTVGMTNLPTYYGSLSYRMRLEGSRSLRVRLEGNLKLPKGGIVIEPPFFRPLRQVEVNGRAVTRFAAGSFVCRECPAEAIVRV